MTRFSFRLTFCTKDLKSTSEGKESHQVYSSEEEAFNAGLRAYDSPLIRNGCTDSFVLMMTIERYERSIKSEDGPFPLYKYKKMESIFWYNSPALKKWIETERVKYN